MEWKLSIRDAATNLLLLVLVALPLVFLTDWAINMIRGEYGDIDVGMALSTGATYTIVFAVPVAVGGVIHQVILGFVPLLGARWQRRGFAFVTAWIIPATVVAFGEPVDVMVWMKVPIVVALLLYSFWVRLPDNASKEAGGA